MCTPRGRHVKWSVTNRAERGVLSSFGVEPERWERRSPLPWCCLWFFSATQPGEVRDQWYIMIDIVLFYVHMFACDSGECVRQSLVCDDINDCGDFSDEDQCGRVIHQSPDASNHRTPSKYRTEIQVIPTSIHLRLLPAESAFTAARNAHLFHQGFDCRARQAGHFTHVELAVFFPGANPSLQYVHVFGSKSRWVRDLSLRHPSLAIHFTDSQHDSLDV